MDLCVVFLRALVVGSVAEREENEDGEQGRGREEAHCSAGREQQVKGVLIHRPAPTTLCIHPLHYAYHEHTLPS